MLKSPLSLPLGCAGTSRSVVREGDEGLSLSYRPSRCTGDSRRGPGGIGPEAGGPPAAGERRYGVRSAAAAIIRSGERSPGLGKEKEFEGLSLLPDD